MAKKVFLVLLVASLLAGSLWGFATPRQAKAAPLEVLMDGPIVAVDENGNGSCTLPGGWWPRICGVCYQKGTFGIWFQTPCGIDIARCNGWTLNQSSQPVEIFPPAGAGVCGLPVDGVRHKWKCLEGDWDGPGDTCNDLHSVEQLAEWGVTEGPAGDPIDPAAAAVGAQVAQEAGAAAAVQVSATGSVIPEGAWWHQTSVGNATMPQLLRETDYSFSGIMPELERVFLRDSNTLSREGLLGFQFSRHIPPEGTNPHHSLLWVGRWPGRLQSAQDMVRLRGWHAARERARLRILVAEEQRLLAGYPQNAEQVAYLQAKIEMGVTRLQIAESLSRQGKEDLLRSLWRPAIFQVEFTGEATELNKLHQAASVNSGQIGWNQARSVIVGTDITVTEEEFLRRQFPGITVYKDSRLNWAPDNVQYIENALASLRNSDLDEQLFRELGNPATRAATAQNIWGRLPQPIYNVLARGNEFVLYQLPQLAMYAYVVYVEAEIVVDLWGEVPKYQMAETNMSWPEWLMSYSDSYEELKTWIPFPTWYNVTLQRDKPILVVWKGDFFPSMPGPPPLDRIGPLGLNVHVGEGEPFDDLWLKDVELGRTCAIFKGWEGGFPIIEDEAGNRVVLDGEKDWVFFCVKLKNRFTKNEYIVILQYTLRWIKIDEEAIRLKVLPAMIFTEVETCPW